MVGDDGESLPADVRERLDAYAAETGDDTAQVLARAVAVYLAAVDDSETSLDDVESLFDRVDDVETEVESLEGELDEKIEDVRMRVVQVKRETDQKAPADHDHPGLAEQVRHASEGVDEVRRRLADLDDRVDAGFENYEEVLSYLDETTADLDEKLRTVARALLNLQSRVTDVEAAHLERRALGELLRVANVEGETTAKCEECGQKVTLSLLTEPRCPECRSSFRDLSPSRGFFGSATLHTGQPPALAAAETEGDDPGVAVDDILDDPVGPSPAKRRESAEGTESTATTESAATTEDERPHEAHPEGERSDD